MAQPPDPVYSFRGEMAEILCMTLTRHSETSYGNLSLLVGTTAGLVHQWDVKTKREKKKIRIGESACVSLVETAEGYASMEKSESVKIWSFAWDLIETIPIEFCGFCNLDYLNGKLFFPEQDAKLSIAHLTKDGLTSRTELVHKTSEKLGEVMCVKALDNLNVATCYESGLIAIWNTDEGNVICEADISTTPVCVDYCEKTSILIIGSTDCTILKLSFTNEKLEIVCKREITNPGISSVKLRDDGKIVVATCWDAKIRYFSVKNMRLLAVLDDGFSSAGNCAVFSRDDDQSCKKGHLFVGSRDGRVTLWNLYVEK